MLSTLCWGWGTDIGRLPVMTCDSVAGIWQVIQATWTITVPKTQELQVRMKEGWHADDSSIMHQGSCRPWVSDRRLVHLGRKHSDRVRRPCQHSV